MLYFGASIFHPKRTHNLKKRRTVCGALVCLLISCWSYSQGQEAYYAGRLDSSKTLEELLAFAVYSNETDTLTYQLVCRHNDDTLTQLEQERVIKEGFNLICVDSSATDKALWKFLETDSVLPPGKYEIVFSILSENTLNDVNEEFEIKLRGFPFEMLSVEKKVDEHIGTVWLSCHEERTLFLIQASGHRADSLTSAKPVPLRIRRHENLRIGCYHHGIKVSDTVLPLKSLLATLAVRKATLGLKDNADELLKMPKPEKPDLKPKLGVDAVYEYQCSTIDTIFRELPNRYHRVFLRPSVQLAGIPFSSEFYYTTESGMGYNLNSFNLSFDRWKWEDISDQNLQAISRQTDNAISVYHQELEGIDSELDRLEGEGQRMQGMAQSSDSLVYDHLGKEGDKLQDRVLDSLNDYKAQVGDSLASRKDSLKPEMDSTALKKWEKVNAYMSEIQARRQELLALRNKVDSKLKLYEEKKRELENKTASADSVYGDAKDKVLGKVRGLQIGLHNPSYSRAVLQGIPVSGVSADIEHKGFRVKATHGKYTDTNSMVFARVPASFPNTVSALRAGYMSPSGHGTDVSIFRFLKPEITPQYVLGLQSQTTQGSLLLKGETHTFLADPSLAIITLANSQLKGEARYTIPKVNVTLSTSYERAGELYQAPGVPFYRNNMQRLEARVEKLWWKGTLQTNAFVRNERPVEANGLPYSFTGMGAELLASLPNGLALGASYTPFQQSLTMLHQNLQQQTQFAVVNGFANHRYMVLQTRHQTMVNYTSMQYSVNGEAPKLFRQYSLNQQIKFPYPFALRGTLNFIDNQKAENDDKAYALTGNAEFTFSLKKWAISTQYAKNLNYLDGSAMSSIGGAVQYKPVAWTQVELNVAQRHFENWPFIGTQQEQLVNLRLSFSF